MIDGFVFYSSFYDAIQELSDADRLAVYDAICKYALTGETDDLDGIPSLVFKLVKPQLDANNKRRENAQKGGRPSNKKPTDSKEKNQRIPKEKTNGFENKKPKEKEKEKEKEKVKVKEKSVKEKNFTPPTKEEVRAYCAERGNKVDPDRFYEYYTAGNWVDQRGQPVKNWKQKLITWERQGTPKGNQFQTKAQHDYDFAEIERQLVGQARTH